MSLLNQPSLLREENMARQISDITDEIFIMCLNPTEYILEFLLVAINGSY